jgi:hypothetical protein
LSFGGGARADTSTSLPIAPAARRPQHASLQLVAVLGGLKSGAPPSTKTAGRERKTTFSTKCWGHPLYVHAHRHRRRRRRRRRCQQSVS